LAAAGEALAIAEHDPDLLAELLHRSARTFATHGDRTRAEAQWVRALAIVRRLPDDTTTRAEQILTGLSELYRQWGRLGKALDVNLRLVDLRRAAKDTAGTADALATVADTMRAAGRLDSAAMHLAQADEVMSQLTDTADVPSEILLARARILVTWGRTLWEEGNHGAARRRWSLALAMMIDIDDNAADQVRAMLATAPQDPLPAG
jgi:tetratricopeptide (TPR) repeat protein